MQQANTENYRILSPLVQYKSADSTEQLDQPHKIIGYCRSEHIHALWHGHQLLDLGYS
jgi:hypothetical protein